MYIYKLEQKENQSYDTYDNCVVIAKDENEASEIHPEFHNGTKWDSERQQYGELGTRMVPSRTSSYKLVEETVWFSELSYSWASHKDNVIVTLLGEAVKGQEVGVVCSSYNAG